METALFFFLLPPSYHLIASSAMHEQKRKKAAEWEAGCSTYAGLRGRCIPVLSIVGTASLLYLLQL